MALAQQPMPYGGIFTAYLPRKYAVSRHTLHRHPCDPQDREDPEVYGLCYWPRKRKTSGSSALRAKDDGKRFARSDVPTLAQNFSRVFRALIRAGSLRKFAPILRYRAPAKPVEAVETHGRDVGGAWRIRERPEIDPVGRFQRANPEGWPQRSVENFRAYFAP